MDLRVRIWTWWDIPTHKNSKTQNKYGTLQELRSTFSHINSINIDFRLVWFVSVNPLVCSLLWWSIIIFDGLVSALLTVLLVTAGISHAIAMFHKLVKICPHQQLSHFVNFSTTLGNITILLRWQIVRINFFLQNLATCCQTIIKIWLYKSLVKLHYRSKNGHFPAIFVAN